MEREKISVIVPVYNVEKYLPACLDSLVEQTYQNLEIILVDDGSTDSSGRICDEYAGKDSRIQVIHKKNAGVAMARNSGIICATGEYISFVDSDDWLAKNAYRILYWGLKKYHAQCTVGCCVHVVDKGGKLVYEKTKGRPLWCGDSRKAMKRVLLEGSAIWNRLFKREVFDTVRFPKGRVNDDEVAALHAYERCEKVVFLNRYTYFYRLRKNSVTTSAFSLRNLDFYYNSLDNFEFIRKTAPRLIPCAQYRIITALLYCYIKMRMKRRKTLEEKQKTVWLSKEIKRHKKMAARNPYCSLWMKVAMIILSII